MNVWCLGRHDEPVEAEQGWLCLKCYGRLRTQLVELPAIAAWLYVNQATTQRAAGDRVSGSSEDPIPLRVDVLDLIGPAARNAAHAARLSFENGTFDDQQGDPGIEPFLRAWAERLHWDHEVPWPDDTTISGFVGYLTADLRWISDQPWVDELWTELRELHQAASRVAPWREPTHREKGGVCEECEATGTLVTHPGDGVVVCEKRFGGCGHRRKQTEYEFRARHLAG